MKWYLKCIGNYATFSGRARRKEFWYFTLFHVLFCYIFIWLDNLLGTTFEFFNFIEEMNQENYSQLGMAPPPTIKYGWFYMIYGLAFFLPALAVSWRRMQDIGKSGWLILVPIYGMILCFFNSEEGENKHGPNPKG